MTLSEQRKAHFDAFTQGKATVYAVSSGSAVVNVPNLAFRKLSEERVAILAWMDQKAAEEWSLAHIEQDSMVITLTYSDLCSMLSDLTPTERQGYTIELI